MSACLTFSLSSTVMESTGGQAWAGLNSQQLQRLLDHRRKDSADERNTQRR
jgi:hypothetical protein